MVLMIVSRKRRNMRRGSKEADMNLKKMFESTLKDVALKEASNKILPMDADAPKLGWKAKLAGVLATIAAIAAAGSQLLGG